MPPTLRPRKGQNKTEKTKPKAEKQVRNSRKNKRKNDAKDIVDGPPDFDSTGKRFRLSDNVDGGPVRFYPMARRGPVFIINNYAGNEDYFAYRRGSGTDVGKLTDCFGRLGFSYIQCFNNLSCDEMKQYISDLASKNWRICIDGGVDCIVIVILSHGYSSDDVRDGIMGAKGQSVTVDELLSPFRKFNSSLVGKPKIFMIQKCRGKEVSMGIREPNALAAEPSVNASASSLPSVPSEGLPSHPNVESSGYLPLQADHLIAFSTSPGYVAYRDTECGSWYIDELTRALCEEYGSEGRRNRNPRHLVDVITHVQGMVSNRIQGKFKVQMPEFRSTLRGPIYF